jgi:3-hydroxyisobutyrate dehydrogenase-like beta-hydroxyacid dehydrogenase
MVEKIGFIGLGSMGFPMARNLLRSGFSVSVYNRTISKAEPLIREGAKLVSCPADLLSEASTLITIVSDDKALEEVVFGSNGFGKDLSADHCHLSMSTISPDLSRQLDFCHKEKGADYLVATVSGRPEGAIAQKLWIFLAGRKEAKIKVQKILETLGQKIFDVGEEPCLANIIKLCGNFLILSSVEALAEASAFAKKNGLSPKLMTEILGTSLFSCPIYQIYGKLISEEAFSPPGFQLSLGKKDIHLVRDVAEKSCVPMPLADLLYQRLLSALAKGRENLDWGAISISSLEDAGIKTSV